MRINFAIKKLEGNLTPYLNFWTEWLKNSECSLNEDEINMIKFHAINNFKLGFFDSLKYNGRSKHIERINAKLLWDRRKFNQWIILNFLFSIIELARNNGGQTYLHQPIGILNLDEDLKKCLFRLNILYMNQIFEKYTEEDLESEKIFKVIKEFECLKSSKKMLEEITIYK